MDHNFVGKKRGLGGRIVFVDNGQKRKGGREGEKGECTTGKVGGSCGDYFVTGSLFVKDWKEKGLLQK